MDQKKSKQATILSTIQPTNRPTNQPSHPTTHTLQDTHKGDICTRAANHRRFVILSNYLIPLRSFVSRHFAERKAAKRDLKIVCDALAITEGPKVVMACVWV